MMSSVEIIASTRMQLEGFLGEGERNLSLSLAHIPTRLSFSPSETPRIVLRMPRQNYHDLPRLIPIGWF